MKKLVETIFGMQYEELVSNGKDGGKARFNGNLLLSAYVIVFIFLLLMVATHIPDYHESMNRFLSRTFGRASSGRMIGRLLTIPLLFIIYFSITKTIGSESSFQKHVKAYAAYSPEAKKKSFRVALLPFFIMLGLLLILALT